MAIPPESIFLPGMTSELGCPEAQNISAILLALPKALKCGAFGFALAQHSVQDVNCQLTIS